MFVINVDTGGYFIEEFVVGGTTYVVRRRLDNLEAQIAEARRLLTEGNVEAALTLMGGPLARPKPKRRVFVYLYNQSPEVIALLKPWVWFWPSNATSVGDTIRMDVDVDHVEDLCSALTSLGCGVALP